MTINNLQKNHFTALAYFFIKNILFCLKKYLLTLIIDLKNTQKSSVRVYILSLLTKAFVFSIFKISTLLKKQNSPIKLKNNRGPYPIFIYSNYT